MLESGDWQIWTTIKDTIYLEAGIHEITLYAFEAGFNLNWSYFGTSSGIEEQDKNKNSVLS
jgi:hypothetical protein